MLLENQAAPGALLPFVQPPVLLLLLCRVTAVVTSTTNTGAAMVSLGVGMDTLAAVQ
jgi:hypothetical protein